MPGSSSVHSYQHEAKTLLKLSWPIALGQMGQNLIGLTDTLMVGQLGSVPLAANSFAFSLFFVFLIFGLGALAPITGLFAKADGEKDFASGGELLRHSLVVSGLISIFLIGCLYLFIPFLHLFGQTPEVLAAAIPFFKIITWSIVPVLIFQSYRQFTDGIGHTRLSMLVMFLGVIINAIGNWFLIPKMGLEGAGWATLITRILMALTMMSIVHLRPLYQSYFAKKWIHRTDRQLLKNLLRLGLPNALTFVFEVATFSGAAFMMGWFGAMPLAAHQVTITVASMSFMIVMGLGVGGTIRVGYERGRKNSDGVRRAGITAIVLGALFMLSSAALITLFRHVLPTFFIADADVIALAAQLFIVVALFQLSDGIQVVAVGALRGLADTRWPSIISFIAYWLIGLPVGYYLAFHAGVGPMGIWWGLFAGLSVSAVLMTWRFLKISTRSE